MGWDVVAGGAEVGYDGSVAGDFEGVDVDACEAWLCPDERSVWVGGLGSEVDGCERCSSFRCGGWCRSRSRRRSRRWSRIRSWGGARSCWNYEFRAARAEVRDPWASVKCNHVVRRSDACVRWQSVGAFADNRFHVVVVRVDVPTSNIDVAAWLIPIQNSAVVGCSKVGRGRWVSFHSCLLYTSPSPRDATLSRMPSSA